VATTVFARNRAIRRKAMREYLSVQMHYTNFGRCMAAMEEIADSEIITAESRERFAMLAALADRHLKIVLHYLPTPNEPDGCVPVQEGRSIAQTLVERIAASNVATAQ